MSREPRTDRHTALAWPDSIEAQHRATQRGATWAELNAAVRAHMTHDAGCLADIGTESLCEQALLPTQPADLDTPDSGIPTNGTLLLAAVIGVAAAVLASWLLPNPWF